MKFWPQVLFNESSECRNKPSKECLSVPVSATCETEEQHLMTKLKVFRVRNLKRVIIAHINMNPIRKKTDLLAEGVSGSFRD